MAARGPRAAPLEEQPVEHGSVVVRDGTRLAYQLDGPADASPLLLLQGQANSHSWWDRVRPGLARTHRTLTVDYRGTGDSHTPPATGTSGEPWSTGTFAADAVAVLDHLGLDAVGVYGTSLGGRVAQMLAIHHPARVARLVLACTSPGGPRARERSQEVRRALAHPDARERRRALLDLMYTPDYARTSGTSSPLLGDPGISPDAARQHLRASARHDASADLARIAAPTLVLHGTDDLMTPAENAHLIAKSIPGARLRLTAGGRHGFFEEFAATVTPAVLGFLA